MFDNHLSFEEHLRLVFIKINRIIGLLCKLQCLIPTSATLTTNKTFVSLHLHYGDIIYEKAYNSSFHQKIEPVRYNTCLTITGALRGTSIEKLYDELSLQSLQLHRWFGKLCNFYKFYKNEFPYTPFQNKTYFFKKFAFSLSCCRVEKSEALVFLKTLNTILKFIRPTPISVFNFENYRGIKLITRLRAGLLPFA